jgi:hypothetical protein
LGFSILISPSSTAFAGSILVKLLLFRNKLEDQRAQRGEDKPNVEEQYWGLTHEIIRPKKLGDKLLTGMDMGKR